LAGFVLPVAEGSRREHKEAEEAEAEAEAEAEVVVVGKRTDWKSERF